VEKDVLVGILVIRLHQVVVDVLDRELGPDPVEAQRLELEHHQRAVGVLGERLVDAQGDLLPGRGSPATKWLAISCCATFCAADYWATGNPSFPQAESVARVARWPR
jgi:hypothetical protein